MAYFNFDEHPEYKQFFESTKDVERILQNLMMASGEIIKKDQSENTPLSCGLCRIAFGYYTV